MHIVISYDIQDDKRRTKIHKTLKDYNGAWVQYSVFECRLTKANFLILRHRLKKLVDPDRDESIRFYRLCNRCKARIERIGGIVPPEKRTTIVVTGTV